MVGSVVLFGDSLGIPQLLEVLPAELIRGLVGADIRRHDHPQLRSIAETSKVPLLIQPKRTSPRYPSFLEQILDVAPDLILVNSYSMLLGRELLEMPKCGAVNIHGALLPQYRGSNPIQWALLNNEIETGVTMHYMSADFDTGDIIAERRVPIHFEDTWRDIQTRILAATQVMLAEEIPRLLSHANARQPQDQAKARYFRRRHPEDGRIDWQDSILSIYNLVRALIKPHPGAFYYQGTDKVVLDEYLSIPKLTALKYSAQGGGQILRVADVVLTPLTLEDLTALLGGINGHEQGLLSSPNKKKTEVQRKQCFESLRRLNDLIIFGIRLAETGELIGSCRLKDIDYIHYRAELQIALNEVSFDHSYFKAAVRSLLDFAFKQLGLYRVCSHVLSTDRAVIIIYEQTGFKHEGTLKEAARIDGKQIDVIVMGISRNEFVAE